MSDSPSGLPERQELFSSSPVPFESPEGSRSDTVIDSVVDRELANGGSSIAPRRFGLLGYLIATIAWLVIFGFVALTLANPFQLDDQLEPGTDVPLAFSDQVPGMVEVGAGSIAPNPEERDKMTKSFDEAASANPGRYNLRLARAIVLGELTGPDAAQHYLQELDAAATSAGYQPKPTELARRQVLGRLYQDVAAGNWELPAVSAVERQDLQSFLGWYGRLALAPAGSPQPVEGRAEVLGRAQTLFVFLILLMGGFLLASFASLTAGVVTVVLASFGRIRFDRRPIVSRGTVYLETFLIWLILFATLPALLQWIAPANLQTGFGLIGACASLIALVWPPLRGVPWGETLQDIGLRWHSTPVEIAMGAWAYLVGLPLIAGSLFVSILLIGLFSAPADPNSFESPAGPAHPIQQMIGQGDLSAFLFIAFAAVIMAPLLEETVFRGLLYRHLREVTGSWWRLVSVLASALLTGFVFAAIHPQGILLVPPLGMLGALFAITREWRGSLVAPMTMHAIHNGTLIAITIVVVMLTS